METHSQNSLEKWFPSYVRLGFCAGFSRLLRGFQQIVIINAESFLGWVPLVLSSPKWKKKKLVPKELGGFPSKHILKWERTFVLRFVP
jgi:hypothetical protein